LVVKYLTLGGKATKLHADDFRRAPAINRPPVRKPCSRIVIDHTVKAPPDGQSDKKTAASRRAVAVRAKLSVRPDAWSCPIARGMADGAVRVAPAAGTGPGGGK